MKRGTLGGAGQLNWGCSSPILLLASRYLRAKVDLIEMNDHFPFFYQIICLALTLLFIFVFRIARAPRTWRRRFQSIFYPSTTFSVNQNRVIDRKVKNIGILVAMAILVANVTVFLIGVTSPGRKRFDNMTPEERYRVEEIKRIQGKKWDDTFSRQTP